MGQYRVVYSLPEHRARYFVKMSKDWWLEVVSEDLPTTVLMRVGRTSNGSLVCTGLILGVMAEYKLENEYEREPKPIRARDLREIRVGEILEKLEEDLTNLPRIRGVDPSIQKFFDDFMAVAATEGVRKTRAPRSRPGRRGYDETHYEEIAILYEEACDVDPYAPIKYIADREHVSVQTARRWVRGAEKRGLLQVRHGRSPAQAAR